MAAPVPNPKPLSPTLDPSWGFKPSIWPQLTPSARAQLLTEILVVNPHLTVRGGVDYASGREPLLYDSRTGEAFSILGQLVTTGGGTGGPLQVTVPPGGFQVAGFVDAFDKLDPMWLVLILGAALLLLEIGRK